MTSCYTTAVFMRRFLAFWALLFALPCGMPARDFPDSPTISDPWSVIERRPGIQLAPAVHGDISFHDYALLSGPHDLFSVRARFGGVPVAVGPVAIGARWASFLLVGPLDPGDQAASVAEWWMNAVQFEYGIYAGIRLGRLIRSASIEYARTSQHPFRSGFSEIASDVVAAGLWPDRLVRRSAGGKEMTFHTGAVVSHVDLYDFWQSTLKKPRTLLRFTVPLKATIQLVESNAGRIGVAVQTEPRLLILRTEGINDSADVVPRAQAEIDLEAVLFLAGDARFEAGIEFFTTQDSEQRRTSSSPLTTLGFVFRVSGPDR